MRLLTLAHFTEVQVKSKKLIILISVLVVVIAIIVIMASVFAVRKVSLTFHNFDGSQALPGDDAPIADEVLKLCKGKSIFFMSKSKLINDLHSKYPEWHVYDIIKSFPNGITVHFVKREVACKLDIGGNTVYVDTYGYVVPTSNDYTCLDVSSAFEHRDVSVNEVGRTLQFADPANNSRLTVVLNAISATWRCYVELDEMPVVLGTADVFTFDKDGSFVINTGSGAKIKIVEPSVDLAEHLFAAYSVYYNEKFNLQQGDVVITVEKDGKIITPNTDKK